MSGENGYLLCVGTRGGGIGTSTGIYAGARIGAIAWWRGGSHGLPFLNAANVGEGVGPLPAVFEVLDNVACSSLPGCLLVAKVGFLGTEGYGESFEGNFAGELVSTYVVGISGLRAVGAALEFCANDQWASYIR